MPIARIVRECERIPRLYRIAHLRPGYRQAIAYPIGLHWLVRIAHRLWEWSFYYRSSALERLIEQTIERRVEERYQHRVQRDLSEAREQAIRELLNALSAKEK